MRKSSTLMTCRLPLWYLYVNMHLLQRDKIFFFLKKPPWWRMRPKKSIFNKHEYWNGTNWCLRSSLLYSFLPIFHRYVKASYDEPPVTVLETFAFMNRDEMFLLFPSLINSNLLLTKSYTAGQFFHFFQAVKRALISSEQFHSLY